MKTKLPLPTHITQNNIHLAVYPTAHQEVPDNIKPWQHDVSGLGAIISVVDSLLEGKSTIETLVVCHHPNSSGEIIKTYTLGLTTINGVKVVQYLAGIKSKPASAGSYSVVSTPYPTDRALIVATLVCHIIRDTPDCWLFRLNREQFV